MSYSVILNKREDGCVYYSEINRDGSIAIEDWQFEDGFDDHIERGNIIVDIGASTIHIYEESYDAIKQYNSNIASSAHLLI